MLPNDFDSLLPPLENYSFSELDAAAEAAISEFKRRFQTPLSTDDRFGRRYLCFEPHWYIRGRDNWVDEAWWVKVATKKIEQWPQDTFWPVIWALEILLANGVTDYRDVTLRHIEEWKENGAVDPEVLTGLLSFFYPQNEIAAEYIEMALEEPEVYEEAQQYLLRMENPVAIDQVVSRVQENLNDLRSAIEKTYPTAKVMACRFWVFKNLIKLGRSLATTHLTTDVINEAHQAALDVAATQNFDGMTLCSVVALECALAMDWQDVAQPLSTNATYKEVLFSYDHSSPEVAPRKLPKLPWQENVDLVPDISVDVLLWSQLGDRDFSACLAARALVGRFNGHTSFGNVLAGAVGWKRYHASA